MSKIYQLTDNDIQDEVLKVWGNQVVWSAYDYASADNNDNEQLFLYNGSRTIQLSHDNNNYERGIVSISDNNVVWRTNESIWRDRFDIPSIFLRGLFVYDGNHTIQLYDGSTLNIESFYGKDWTTEVSSQDKIIWEGYDGNDKEIYLYDGNTTIQLTNNDTNDDRSTISGDKIAWHGYDGNDKEIYLYDGNTTIQLTNNGTDDFLSTVLGDKIIWHGYDGNDEEIYLHDGNTTIQLTNNDTNDLLSTILGDKIIWENYDGNDNEIYLYDGNTTIQLTNNDTDDDRSTVLGDKIVWHGYDGNDEEIYLYDGNTTIQLTNNDTDDSLSTVLGDKIIWESYDGNDNEIYLYDGNTTIQLTDNNTDDLLSTVLGDLSTVLGDKIIWEGYDGNDNEIYLYDGNTTIQLTDNNTDDYSPLISGNNIIWATNSQSEVNDQIYLYDGNKTIQLTDQSNGTGGYLSSSNLSGNKLVWSSYDGNDSEIYLAVLENNELSEQGLMEFYSFRNTTIESDTQIFVGEEERDAILVNLDFNQTFSRETIADDGGFIPAFVASIYPRTNLVSFYRLRSLESPGTYLFVSTEEYNSIFEANSEYQDKWVKEGIDAEGNDFPEFYLYGVGANEGIEFHRFQHRENHTFLYANPELTATINSDPNLAATFLDQGVAFETF